MSEEVTKGNKLEEISVYTIFKDSLCLCTGLYSIPENVLPEKDAARFEAESKEEGKGTIPIMTYGDYTFYLKVECSALPNIPLSKFNYASVAFEKKLRSESPGETKAR